MKTANGKESGGSPSRLQEQLSYNYDAANNLSSRTKNALTHTFNTEDRDHLTTVTRSGTLTVAGSTTTAATSVTVNGSAANRYGDNTFALGGFSLTDGNNTFTAVAQDSSSRADTNSVTVNLPATVSYTYDANGNLTSDGLRGFEYDDENQLIQITATNSWKTEFKYDGLGRRRIRKEFSWISSAWVQNAEVRYVYDGQLVVQERDGNNLSQAFYTRGSDFSNGFQGAGGIGGLLAWTQSPAVNPQHRFYHSDGVGSVTMLINANQQPDAKYLYDPFGNVLAKSGPLADANVYGFSSKELHPKSGLIYFGFRFYDPNLQRWINRDPLGEPGSVVQRDTRSAQSCCGSLPDHAAPSFYAISCCGSIVVGATTTSSDTQCCGSFASNAPSSHSESSCCGATFRTIRQTAPSPPSLYHFVANRPLHAVDPYGMNGVDYYATDTSVSEETQVELVVKPVIIRNCEAERTACIIRGGIVCGAFCAFMGEGPWCLIPCSIAYGTVCANAYEDCIRGR